jgi:hypothetical protein
MAMPEEPPTMGLTDREVVDDHLQRIGKVTDVIYDPSIVGRARWATVKTGALGGEHVAPLAGAYRSEDGRLVLAFDRGTVKHAPKPPHDHVFTPEVEAELEAYYHLADR